MKISHQGMFNDGGTPFSLAAGIKVGIHQQASFAHYGKLATRTTNVGEVDICGLNERPVGVFFDVSPQGDSCTIESEGYVWVPAYAGVAVGDMVTPAAAGAVAKCTEPAGGAVTLAEATTMLKEQRAGIWQVDAVNGTLAQIKLCGC